MKIKKYLKSFYSILLINLKFFFSKFNNKKTILFFHPVDDLTKIHDFYLRKLSKNLGNNFTIINCHKSFKDLNKDKHYYISYLSLKFIFFVIFLFPIIFLIFFLHFLKKYIFIIVFMTRL